MPSATVPPATKPSATMHPATKPPPTQCARRPGGAGRRAVVLVVLVVLCGAERGSAPDQPCVERRLRAKTTSPPPTTTTAAAMPAIIGVLLDEPVSARFSPPPWGLDAGAVVLDSGAVGCGFSVCEGVLLGAGLVGAGFGGLLGGSRLRGLGGADRGGLGLRAPGVLVVVPGLDLCRHGQRLGVLGEIDLLVELTLEGLGQQRLVAGLFSVTVLSLSWA